MKPLGIEIKIKEFWDIHQDKYFQILNDKESLYKLNQSDVIQLAYREFIWWYCQDKEKDSVDWVFSQDGIAFIKSSYKAFLNSRSTNSTDNASQKQINYIRSLIKSSKSFYFDENNSITKTEASAVISYLLNRNSKDEKIALKFLKKNKGGMI